MIKFILYDLDGVLVDACHWHFEALNQALLEIKGFKIQQKEHRDIFNGLPTRKKLEILEDQGRIQNSDFSTIWDKKQELTFRTIEKSGNTDLEKIKLHKATRIKKITSACVTNSIRDTALLMLKKTGQIDFMKFVIANDDVANPKPHAEPYIRAMIRLGSMPEETLIIEDSDKGYEAAIKTGAHVLRVENPSDVTIENILEFIEKER